MKTTHHGIHPPAELNSHSAWLHLLEESGGARRLARNGDPTRRRLFEIARSYDRVVAQASGDLHPEPSERDVLATLHVVRTLRKKLDDDERALMAMARTKKVTWARIAAALGMRNRQSAERRYLQLGRGRPGPDGTVAASTQNERVEAAREQRLRRAELDWALGNALPIRTLASDLAALPDLQERADESREARLMAVLRVPVSAGPTESGAKDPADQQMSWPTYLTECLREYERFLNSPEDYLTAEQRHLGDTQWQVRRTEAEIVHRLLGLLRTAAQERDIDLSDHPELLDRIRALTSAFREAMGRRRR